MLRTPMLTSLGTLKEKEKMLETSILSFSTNVFYLMIFCFRFLIRNKETYLFRLRILLIWTSLIHVFCNFVKCSDEIDQTIGMVLFPNLILVCPVWLVVTMGQKLK